MPKGRGSPSETQKTHSAADNLLTRNRANIPTEPASVGPSSGRLAGRKARHDGIRSSVPTADPICGRRPPTHKGCNQMFEPRFAGSNGEALEIHAAIGEQKEPCSVGQRESAHFSLDTARTAKFIVVLKYKRAPDGRFLLTASWVQWPFPWHPVVPAPSPHSPIKPPP
jgi:hypothetical protein